MIPFFLSGSDYAASADTTLNNLWCCPDALPSWEKTVKGYLHRPNPGLKIFKFGGLLIGEEKKFEARATNLSVVFL